ncbi:MAG TPA: tandem-95 repeat protein, partial [Thermoplasmata archaeon]|nr:tandem-95 repeat protein [Thermoplasmata archaeon]
SGVSTATGKVRFRATMSTADTLVTPTLSEIRLSYTHVLDHFYVTASPTATAGAPFSITITAKDAGNATIIGWTGTVALAAFLSDGITPGGGTLGTTSLAIAAGGTATLATETYTKAETIKVRATFAAATGLSGPVAISPGPVSRVVIAPNNVTLLPFDTADFAGQAFDVFDNAVPGVGFNWTVGGGVGSLNISTGPVVRFTASPPPANGTLQMAFGPIADTAQIHVVSGVKPWITIAAPAAGAHVTGMVPIGYANSSDAVTVRFEYDGGAGWTLIGTTAVLNGTYDWDTSPLNFVGGSLRAIVTNNRTITNATVVTPIEVDNTPPTIALGAIVDNQAGSGTLTIPYVTDPDVVRVDLTYFDGAWNPIGSDVTIDGTYLWTPGVPINGVTLRAVAVDEVGLKGADQKQGVGNFPPGPNPPVIAAIPDVYVRVGVAYALNLTFYVTDPDTPRSALVISDSDAANVTAVSGAYPALDITYGSVGTFLVTVWVSDGTDTAWTIVRVIASAAQSPPDLVAAPPPVTFDEDTIALNGLGVPATTFFLDPDGDPLAFAVLDGSRVFALVNGNGTIDFWAAANWSGSEWLRLRATDPSGGFAEAAFAVVVRPVNDAPILVTAFAAITFDEDTLAPDVFGGNVSGHFFDVDGDPLTITVLGIANVSARVSLGDTIDLWATANWSGTQTLRVRATDPNGTFVEGSFLVTVRPINDPPIVAAALPSVTFDEDTVALNAFGGAVTLHFFDVDGDVLTFTVLGPVQVTARVNADRTIDFWAAANWSGSEALRVRAADPSGGFVDAPFQVIVRPVDDGPTLAPIPALTINEGDSRTLDLSAYVSDIDTNRSLLVVTTDSPYVTANGFVLTMAFPSNWTNSRFTVSVSDGTLAAFQVVSVTILPPFWKSVYFLPVPPMFLAVVIGVFAQRARWRPTKAFLVDERGEMIREFTLDRSCDVTFDQVRQAGALDAVDKSVKVSKYHAQTVRGDALGLVLLAYGPVTADQIEFAREMLVNVQDKFDDHVKARISE